MESGRKLRIHLVAQGWLLFALLLIVVMLAAYIAREYRYERDITHAGRNTITEPTRQVLGELDSPLTITVYAVAQSASGANMQKLAEERLQPYLREKRDIRLLLIDPRERPKEAAAAGIRTPNEMVVEYRGRTERIAVEAFNEQNFANLLLRLARGDGSAILWLDGHGERKLDGIANHDLGDFGRHLRARGFSINSVNLAVAQDVPANAALLIVAHPQIDLLASEAQKIRRFLEAGGNLLWLVDQEPLRGLQPVAEYLGLVFGPGTVVDFALKPERGPPVFAVGTPGNYGRHPATSGARFNTLFPHARQIVTVESETWRITPLIDVAQRGWVETGDLKQPVTFDKARDVPGPVTIAAAFERTVGEKPQRVVVVGTGHFLSNSFIGNGGNLDLGLNLINWLSGAGNLVAVQRPAAADARLEIDQSVLYLIAFSVLFVLPFAFALAGGIIWWRRRGA